MYCQNRKELVMRIKEQARRGFTLIELLVVVLIIGILSAIALPQYKKAVMKARFVEVKMGMSSYMSAIDMYLMTNGYPASSVNFTSDSGLLDKEVPTYGKIGNFSTWQCGSNYCMGQFYANAGTSSPFAGCGIVLQRNKGDTDWSAGIWGNDTFMKLACDWWINEFGGNTPSACN